MLADDVDVAGYVTHVAISEAPTSELLTLQADVRGPDGFEFTQTSSGLGPSVGAGRQVRAEPREASYRFECSAA